MSFATLNHELLGKLCSISPDQKFYSYILIPPVPGGCERLLFFTVQWYIWQFLIFPEFSEGRCHSIECQRANLCLILFFQILLVTRKSTWFFLNDLIHLRNAHLIPTFIKDQLVHNSNQRIIPQALCEEGLHRLSLIHI